ncbi:MULTISPECIES: AMP-binding protein [Sphingobium]|uniref:AMP-binding protein n=1 Tax=Sphingobium TaxID=165695 RepID=UPI00159BF2A3|nr:AMP-binding protein [Sphingobium sp. 15-1]
MSQSNHNAVNFGAQALLALRRFPDRIAFRTDMESYSYGATLELIGRMQAVFAGRGLRNGDIVAILTDNSFESWCATIAVQTLGCGVTALHPKNAITDHIFQVKDAGAKCLIIDALGHGATAAALLPALEPGIDVLAIGKADFAPDLVRLAEETGTATPCSRAEPDDIAMIHYTGGTTGRAKGAVRLQRTASAFALFAPLSDYELPELPSYLGVAPNSHAAGTFILPLLWRGGTIHLMRGFDVEQALAIIERERINFTFLVPSMIYTLLDDPALGRRDISSLETLFYGASAIAPPRLLEAVERLGPILSQGYGQTECLPLSILRRADHRADAPHLLSSCGFPAASATVALLDEDGKPVPTGEPGEICVRSPAALDRYHNLPELTAETLAGGWLHTGDIGTQDERGYLYIVDRKKDMIISGGFNIYSRDVEDALTSHEQVDICAVIGTPHPKWGEAVTAYVIRKAGADVSEQALAAHVKARKGSLYAPKRVEFVDALPLTAVGKIDKKALRDLAGRTPASERS